MKIDEYTVGVAYDLSFIIYLSLKKGMGEKWKRLAHRYVDKTGGRENWVVRCSIDFMQKFGYAIKSHR